MGTGYIPDAVILNKLEAKRGDLFQYIEKNIGIIDDNLPLFLGKVTSLLEKANVTIPDPAHDALIDAVTFKVMSTSPRATDAEYIARLCELTKGMKREHEKVGGIDLAAGITLMKHKQYLQAAPYLEPYRSYDAQIGCWHAFCYYALYRDGSEEPGFIPSERWNYFKIARKLMGELGQWSPAYHRLISGELDDMNWLWEAFWLMIFSAMEWLPEERWYIELGIKKAKETENEVILARLLQIALVRFPHDMSFYREAYFRNFNEGELDGAIALVREMEKQHPLELEPLYYGLRTSFYMQDASLYSEYRRAAVEKQMPVHVLQILDFGYAFMKGKTEQAGLCLDEFGDTFPQFRYFSGLMEYIVVVQKLQDNDTRRAVFRAIDQFCIRMLQIPAT